jgi:hypothetical protein
MIKRKRNGKDYELYTRKEADLKGIAYVYWRTHYGPPNYPHNAMWVLGDDQLVYPVVSSHGPLITLPDQMVNTKVSCYLKDHGDVRWRSEVFPHDDPFDANRPVSVRERKVALAYIASGYDLFETYARALARDPEKAKLITGKKVWEAKRRVENYVTRPAVERFIVKSITGAMEEVGLDDAYLLDKLKDLIEQPARPHIALEALKMGFKLAGHLEKAAATLPGAGFVGLSFEEVKEIEGSTILTPIEETTSATNSGSE